MIFLNKGRKFKIKIIICLNFFVKKLKILNIIYFLP